MRLWIAGFVVREAPIGSCYWGGSLCLCYDRLCRVPLGGGIVAFIIGAIRRLFLYNTVTPILLGKSIEGEALLCDRR